VSSDDQAERQTIQAQLDFLRRLAELHNLTIVDEYPDDGVSGTIPLDERPQGRRLLDDAKHGRFGAVIFFKTDRLARSLTVMLRAYEALDAAGVSIRSGTEPYDTSTPIGRFIFQMLGSFAELERENIKERTSHGRDRIARDGRFTGGVVPVGYDLGSDGRLTPSVRHIAALGITEAALVAEVFERIAGGSSAGAEAARLNALGVPVIYRQGRNEAKKCAVAWSPARIGAVIHNPVYKGRAILKSRFGPVEYPVPALVDEAAWSRAQAVLTRNKALARRNHKREYLLRALIRCGNCGLGYTGATLERRRADGRTFEQHGYRCNGQVMHVAAQKGGRCIGMQVDGRALEAAIWAKCAEIVRNPGEHLEASQQQLRARLAQSTDSEGRRQTLLAAIAAREAERERMLSLYKRGRISIAELDTQLDETAAALATLSAELQALRLRDDLTAFEEQRITQKATALAMLRDDIDAIEAMPDGPDKYARQREIVELLVNEITVHTEGEGRAKTSRIVVSMADEPRDGVVETETRHRAASTPRRTSPLPSARRRSRAGR
jgi:site-specific DNA recombinase